MYWYIFRSYYFALKIIFVILNKTTQYISFFSITLFVTFFLLIKQGLFVYEDIFINSLKGLYPEFITSSSSISKQLKTKYTDKIDIRDEIFVHSEEIGFSYEGEDTITKFMNVRTYDEKYKDKLFSTLNLNRCKETPQTIWLSSRLYDNMSEDNSFDKKYLYFIDEDENYHKYPICVFELSNNEKWLLLSTKTAKNIAYMPFTKHIIYTKDKQIKEQLYSMKDINNWKKYIDYDDLGIFLLAKEISSTFLTSFFIFLIVFMTIAFSSLVKEFEASIFLTKLYGLNIYRTVVLYSVFFAIYTLAIGLFVFLEYNLITYFINIVVNFSLNLDIGLFVQVIQILFGIGVVSSIIMAIKYHRLPL